MANLDLVPDPTELEVFSDTDNPVEFQLLDASDPDPDNWTPIDITNDTIKFVARDTHEGTIKIATKSNAPGGHSDPTNGKTQFLLSKTDLALTTVGITETWVYEVRRVIAGSGYEVVYIWGELVIKPQVGQSPPP